MSLYMVKQYKAKLVPEMMEQAIKTIKTRFQKSLAAELDLRRVTAPLFVLSGTGINDDLNGVERPVSFPIKDMGERRADLEFHKALLEDRIPLSIGGGIGQSRLCMFLLRCAHIGEVQASIWPEEMVETCRKHNIYLK